MTKLTCPGCKRTGTTSKSVPNGAKVKCPSCGISFRFEPNGLVSDDALEAPSVLLSPVATSAPITSTQPLLTPVSPHVAMPPNAVPFQQVIQVAAPERQRTNPLGVSALILGILAVLIAWVPFLGLLAIPAGLLGGLLGAIGLLYGLVTRRGKITAAGVGLVLSLGSVVLSVMMTGAAAKGISDAMEEATRKAAVSAPAAVNAAKAVKKVEPNASGVEPGPLAAPPVETWLSPDQAGQLGNVQVRIVSVTLGKVSLRERVPFPGHENDRGQSKEALLSVVLDVLNLDENRKLDFKTLAGSDFSFARDSASLSDNFGNKYRGVSFGFSSLPEFRTLDESIYPNRTIRDQLVFEAPIATAGHLDLEIPGKNVGQEGFFRFRIPATAVLKHEDR
jgi:hypothetical protein